MKSVFHDICDALGRANLHELVYCKNGKRGDEQVERLCELFENAWPRPLQEEVLHKPGQTWREALRDLINTAGRGILKFSHDWGVLQRTIEDLEENWKRRHQDEFTRLLLEMLAAYALGEEYRSLPITILVVDNKPDEIGDYNILLPPQLGFSFWPNANWYVVGGKFRDFEEEIRNLKSRDPESGKPLTAKRWNPITRKCSDSPGVACADIDLILQDQVLGEDEGAPPGSRLAEHYLDVMPQALVFLITGTDVTELAALGEMRFVDRAISKTRLAALPWYYYLAFNEILGAMFWDSWLEAIDQDRKRILSRWTLRRLLGSIRTWIKEPDILWHGQTCAELVDHSQPHISDLWKMANEIFGARNPETGNPLYGNQSLKPEERILLALGIWAHDIGHRGDDERVDPASIREIHASISEGLLLSNRKAFGLEWLDKLCTGTCGCEKVPKDWPDRPPLQGARKTGADSLDKRFVRSLVPKSPKEELCLLRLTGIVSRHHQSSVPLSEEKLPGLITGLKTLHDYTRVGYDSRGSPKIHSVREWCDDNEDYGLGSS